MLEHETKTSVDFSNWNIVYVIDGTYDSSEWSTDEEKFSETVGPLTFDQATVYVTYDIVILRDSENVYFLIKYELDTEVGYNGSASIGIALSDGPTGAMSDYFDRKIAAHNITSDATETFDLYNCNFDEACYTGARDSTPGIYDVQQDIVDAAYGEDGDIKFFEVQFPLVGDNNNEDIEFKEGTKVKIVINPYQNLYNASILVGHGAIASNSLEVTFEQKSFFPRPEGPMDNLALIFTMIFSIIIIAMSLMSILTQRNDKLAEKFLRVDITEEMRDKSVIMEIGYYNSSFVSLFGLFYFWLLALVSVLYGWWANWGLKGLLVNLPALILSSFAGYDLIKRNHNP
ncbi:MAG: hypothetical protein ACXAC2_13880, partial [Candidatus Kariarchaeaceae archaeon]